MNETVMETLKRLPYLSGNKGNREIAPETLALDYLDEDGDSVDVWKDPFCLTEKEGGEKRQQQGYLNNAIPLTSCIGVEGCLLLLDLDSRMYLNLFPFASVLCLSFFLSPHLFASLSSSPFCLLRSSTPLQPTLHFLGVTHV